MLRMLRAGILGILLIGVTWSARAQEAHGGLASAKDSLQMVSLPPELDRVLRDYEKGWRANDGDALAKLFAPDGFILRPGHSPVRGREAIAEAYRNSGGPLDLWALSFAQEDSLAHIIGVYDTGRGKGFAGKYILTLRRLADGRWYITADMDNSNR